MSRNASPIFFLGGGGWGEGALRDIQKTAARETNPTPQLPLTFLLLSGDLRGGNDKNKLSGKRPFLRMPFCVMFNLTMIDESDFDNIQVTQLGSQQQPMYSVMILPILPKLSINRGKACFQFTIYTYVFILMYA